MRLREVLPLPPSRRPRSAQRLIGFDLRLLIVGQRIGCGGSRSILAARKSVTMAGARGPSFMRRVTRFSVTPKHAATAGTLAPSPIVAAKASN